MSHHLSISHMTSMRVLLTLLLKMDSPYQHRWGKFAIASCMQGNRKIGNAVMQQQQPKS